MRGTALSRLVLVLTGPVLLLAAVASGFSQRPSAAETAYAAYLWLGGDPVDLCGGHGPDHLHCDACQPAGPATVPDAAAMPRLAVALHAVLAPESADRAPVWRVLRADARGPPAFELV